MLSFYHKVSHYRTCSAVITMIKHNYEQSYSADEYVWFTAFDMNRGFSSAATTLCICQSWISQQRDVQQWYNERLTQCVTWYFRMACFFLAGGPGWIELCDLGKGTHSYPEGTAFPLHFPHCVQHYVLLSSYTGLWQHHKKCVWQKIPTEGVWITATHICSTNMDTQFIKCLTHRGYFRCFIGELLEDPLVSIKKHMYIIICLRNIC